MLRKRVLLFSAIIVIMVSLLGCKGAPNMPVLSSLQEFHEGKDLGYGVYINFNHTKPGVSSTVIVNVHGQDGDDVELTLRGPAVSSNVTQKQRIVKGSAIFTWTITQYGDYTAEGTYNQGEPNEQNIKASVKVQ